jgi:hypothetical protein
MSQNPEPEEMNRHRHLFEMLCHAERAAQTTARLALPAQQPVDQTMMDELRQAAVRSLAPAPPAERKGFWARLRARKWRHQKKAAASNSTVITPMIAPFDGSVMGIDTRL